MSRLAKPVSLALVVLLVLTLAAFFVKQKTAYEMRT